MVGSIVPVVSVILIVAVIVVLVVVRPKPSSKDVEGGQKPQYVNSDATEGRGFELQEQPSSSSQPEKGTSEGTTSHATINDDDKSRDGETISSTPDPSDDADKTGVTVLDDTVAITIKSLKSRSLVECNGNSYKVLLAIQACELQQFIVTECKLEFERGFAYYEFTHGFETIDEKQEIMLYNMVSALKWIGSYIV